MKLSLPHPLAVFVSSLLALASADACGFSVWNILTFAAVLLPLDIAIHARGISRQKKEVVDSALLLAFARRLGSTSPREAFLNSCTPFAQKEQPLSGALQALRDGRPLPAVMRYLSRKMPSERALFEALSALLEFDAASAGKRIRLYVRLRDERDKLKGELDAKLIVISMRFKLLSVIASASLAVIAFASPLLESFFTDNRIPPSGNIESIFRFDMSSFLVSYSLALVCSYLPTKALPFTSGSRSLLYSSMSYLLTYLVLVLAAASGF
ncbi:MAG: hypothetical protein QFX35_04100 [Candidatus Verstraetearchaeota archaeon]|nr:hypothetical protein [Candidatus Verstraetearchaeota archaeon]